MHPPPEEAKSFKLSQKAEPEALLAPTLFPSNQKPVLLCTEGAGVEYNHPDTFLGVGFRALQTCARAHSRPGAGRGRLWARGSSRLREGCCSARPAVGPASFFFSRGTLRPEGRFPSYLIIWVS